MKVNGSAEKESQIMPNLTLLSQTPIAMGFAIDYNSSTSQLTVREQVTQSYRVLEGSICFTFSYSITEVIWRCQE